MLARAVVIASVLLAPPAQADQHALRLLREWIAAVHAHVPGAPDPAVVSVAQWQRDDLIRARPFVRALIGLVPNPDRRRPVRLQLSHADAAEVTLLAKVALGGLRPNEFVKRAALLHTDVVLLAQSDPRFVAAPKPRSQQSFLERNEATPLVIARGPDGRFEGFELGNLNWEFARELLDAVTPSPADDDTVKLWYRAITATHALSYSFGEAWPHVERARELLPNDPGILFGDAGLQETLASPRIQDYVRVTKLPNEQQFLFVTSARKHLDKAEELLSRAVSLDPAFVEARLRLGRVRGQLGHHEAALVELRKVIDAQPDPTLSFYAHLLAGDAERALARYDAAQQSYQRALDLFPRAQSARMALSHLARLRSDREGALAILAPTLAASPMGRDQDDPWWEYHQGDGRNAHALLRRLRAPFLPGPQP